MQSNISLTNIENSYESHVLNQSLEKKHTQLILKRIFDILFSLLGLTILSPIFLFLAIIIKLDSPGPILFKQTRVGKHGKYFKIYKFRTMIADAEKFGKQITVGKDSRITKMGKMLRKYKFDELPQLINVLIGQMSFVGPRPEVPRYVELYSEFQRQILLVRPGITDYASIEYRNENDLLGRSSNPDEMYVKVIMPSKLEMNLKYLAKLSMYTDIKLILKTIIEILK